jgi:signal transduction histidine kinase
MAQSTPLISRSGTILGMFSTLWVSAHTITTREHRFLDLLARFAADMIQRSRDEQELRQSEQRLRDDSKRKDAFLAVLAHELRNPLASLSAAAQLLGKESLRPEMAAIARDALQRQVFHMARLLDDLLDVARITNGLIKLRPQRVNLAAALQSAVETVSPQIEEMQHRLDLRLSSVAAFVEGDPDRLNQIFVNLLSNAAKYTPIGGQITVRLSMADEQWVNVSILDNGVGISAAMMPQIYEMFSPASHSRGANTGLGIGLAITKSLVQLHGGTIEARSEGENRGSEFIVSLPLLAQSMRIDETQTEVLDTQVIPSLRILIADDNADSAFSWTMLLEQQGHQVRMTLDGREALEEAQRFRPDLALLDIGMPHLDGYQVARAIRNTEWGKRIKLIAVSGWGHQRDIDDAYAAGFDKHLTKPAKLDDFVAIMRTIKPSLA